MLHLSQLKISVASLSAQNVVELEAFVIHCDVNFENTANPQYKMSFMLNLRTWNKLNVSFFLLNLLFFSLFR